MSDPRTQDEALNELRHRELNERMAEYDSEAGFASLALDFVCECFRPECHVHLELTAEAWQRLHVEPELFVVAPGHVDTTREVVLLRTPEYWQVQKPGAAAREVQEREDGRPNGGDAAA
jgi:hypothetical protein